MANNSQIELYKEEKREMNYSTPCSSKSASPHPGTSCSGLSKEPIFLFNGNEEMETDNLSTAASRFGLKSATEQVEEKRDRLRSPAIASIDTGVRTWASRQSRQESCKMSCHVKLTAELSQCQT